MTSLMIHPEKPASRLPMDQISKRILRRLANNVALDVVAIAKDVGASEDVVRHRLGTLQDRGVLRLNLRVDPELLGPTFEYLVSGAASPATDKAAIGRLCSTSDVTRVFGLASSNSLAFTVAGSDPTATQARALDLAREAGLVHPQAVLIVNTFQDRAGTTLPDTVAADPVAA